VDRSVLEGGCTYLRRQLQEGKLAAPLVPQAWLALALAGGADPTALQVVARDALKDAAPEARCTLALACRSAGLNELGERLWTATREWQPETTEHLALKLSVQVAFGAPLEDCRGSAHKLLQRRTGLHWESTQATSWAILALTRMLAYDTGGPAARRVTVTLGDRKLLTLTDPAELSKLVYRVHVPVETPLPEGASLTLSVEGGTEIQFTVSATGTQRLDKVESVDTALRVRRRLETLDGQPLPERWRVGQVFAVRLSIDLAQRHEYVLVEERRPAGCEYADERLGAGDTVPANVEFRDDRLCVFYGALEAGHHELVYYLRAETPGTSHLLPACVYPMYAPAERGESGAGRLEVVAGPARP
jgi:hypothetical protein